MIESTNYDESKVSNYLLPDSLVCEDGSRIKDVAGWETRRRPEILEAFAREIYGKPPTESVEIEYEVISVDYGALNGVATRHQIAIYCGGKIRGIRIALILYIPNAQTRPVPVFLGCNFYGNHAIENDIKIQINTSWMRNTPEQEIVVENQATEFSRGFEASRWPLQLIIANGFGVATFYYGDVEADHPNGWKKGIRGALSSHEESSLFIGEDWGAIAAWSWGLSRALDYLVTDLAVDRDKIAVIGHSRLGKAALWAGATDTRFAMVISNNSGAGGISLARRNFGESIKSINENFPHWFCGNYKKYSNSVENLPVDTHQLASLIAPRPLYIASAEDDSWADPKGEFLAGMYAESVYNLYGKVGVGAPQWPPVNQPVGENVGYHLRSGKHDLTLYDWKQFIQFAKKHYRISL